ncbi:M4 family metallopeptidase [Kineosporia succinea]|uniref:alpha-amylase n=1 Tax=Kineosporia succinea TaxID=84632 RepID=A0ABT9NX44_9ACTN|nr:M4 family metallopeptidase [Kineosporia succinea]MDP9824995.1 Zn-dependent metalloprotease/PKD repeat protein [Kineosporia succinea]
MSTHKTAPEPEKPAATGDALLIEQLVKAGDGQTQISADPLTGAVSYVGFAAGHPWTAEGTTTAAQAAQAFIDRYGTLFGATRTELAASAPEGALGGGWRVRFSQKRLEVPVAMAGLVVRVNQAGRVVSVTGKLSPDVRESTTAAVTPAQATTTAVTEASQNWDVPKADLEVVAPAKAIYDASLLGRAEKPDPQLVWKVRVSAEGDSEPHAADVYVDAASNQPLVQVDKVANDLVRRICDNQNDRAGASTCDSPVREEGGAAAGEPQVNQAYDYLGAVYSFYRERFGRDSINGSGSTLSAIVRACPDSNDDCPYGNAFYNDSTSTMTFGEQRLSDDVTGHEMTHGVTAAMNGLEYLDQSGAINESMSDVFGEFIDRTNGLGNDAADRNWLHGEDAGSGVTRNLADPTRSVEPQPDAMDSSIYQETPPEEVCDAVANDNCGVHHNSGVGNKAGFLITDGGTFNGTPVRGLGIDKAARLYYEAQGLLSSTSRYRDLANALQQGCANLVGSVTDTDDCAQVKATVEATRMLASPKDDNGGAVQNLAACTQNILGRNDDSSTDRIDLPFSVNFFGNTHNSLYVNNNGNVTFDQPMNTFTPFALTSDIDRPIIAPFFADVDTRNLRSDVVTYGASADGKTFCANWAGAGVGYYGGRADKLVRAQLLLTDRSQDPGGRPGDFDIVMNYGQAQWETGDASGGSGGLGGTAVRAGYSAGTGVAGTFDEFPNSGVNGAFLDGSPTALVDGRRDSSMDGRYVFRVRSGQVPVGGSVAGTVYSGSPDPANVLADSFVQVCPTSGDRACNTSSTNRDGAYSVAGLPSGEYRITAYPPGSSRAETGSRTVTIPDGGADLTSQDIVLQLPTPPPAGTSITSISTNPDGLPVLYWGDPLTLRTHGCEGGVATWVLTQGGETRRDGTLAEGADGEYTATIEPLRPISGFAQISITLACPDGTSNVITFDVYIDPSGNVVDTAGHAIEGAEVTLYRSDDISGPFTEVPDGSGLMSPANRRNPSFTTADGHFGWDVVAGYYQVRAEHPNCTSAADPALPYAASETLTIPPPVTDLRLVLTCANRAPSAPDQFVNTPEDTAVNIDLSVGATDPEGDPLTFEPASFPQLGSLACQGAACTYTPGPDYHGGDSFVYSIADGKGGTALSTVWITTTPVNDLPTAAFTLDPTQGNAPLVVRFDAGASVDVEGIDSYAWEFGDGETGTGATVSHTYARAGTYTAKLTVTDTDGAKATAQETVTVDAVQPPRLRDAVTFDRTGSQAYRFGGELDSGDFVVTHKKGTLKTIDGTGVVAGRKITFNINASTRGRAHGRITVADARTGKITDRIRIRGTYPTEDGLTITGTSIWGKDPAHLDRLVWSLTDVPVNR